MSDQDTDNNIIDTVDGGDVGESFSSSSDVPVYRRNRDDTDGANMAGGAHEFFGNSQIKGKGIGMTIKPLDDHGNEIPQIIRKIEPTHRFRRSAGLRKYAYRRVFVSEQMGNYLEFHAKKDFYFETHDYKDEKLEKASDTFVKNHRRARDVLLQVWFSACSFFAGLIATIIPIVMRRLEAAAKSSVETTRIWGNMENDMRELMSYQGDPKFTADMGKIVTALDKSFGEFSAFKPELTPQAVSFWDKNDTLTLMLGILFIIGGLLTAIRSLIVYFDNRKEQTDAFLAFETEYRAFYNRKVSEQSKTRKKNNFQVEEEYGCKERMLDKAMDFVVSLLAISAAKIGLPLILPRKLLRRIR